MVEQMAEATSDASLTREQCEAKANECHDLARHTSQVEHRNMLERMAQAWEHHLSMHPDNKMLQ